MNNIVVTFEDGTKKEYRKGIRLEEIIKDLGLEDEIICGCYNGVIINYDNALSRNGKLELYGINTPVGTRIYEKGFVAAGGV